jgi:hypothetical protein
LHADSTPLQALPRDLPHDLDILSCGRTQIRELPPLPQSLTMLNIEHTRIPYLRAHQFTQIVGHCAIRTHALGFDVLPIRGHGVYCIQFSNPEFSPLDLVSDPFYERIGSASPCNEAVAFVYQNREFKLCINASPAELAEFQAILGAERAAQKARVVARTRAYKEDLMMHTWHPSRVEEWCGVSFLTADD